MKKKCEYKQLILFLSYYYHSGFELSLRTSQIAKWSLIIEFVKLQVFFPLKINSSKLYFCYFIYSLHTLIKRNTAHTQNYNTKCRKCFAILEKHFHLRQGKILATLDIFIVEWISNHNSNAVICVYTFDKFIISCP